MYLKILMYIFVQKKLLQSEFIIRSYIFILFYYMEIIPKCIYNNRAVNICMNQQCNLPNPFICGICANNECRLMHQQCMLLDWESFKKNLDLIKRSKYSDFSNLSNVVEQVIYKVIKQLEKQLQFFKIWKVTFGLPNEAVNLFKSINKNQERKFTGKQVAKILQDMKSQKNTSKINQMKINNQMKVVLDKTFEIQKMIREWYSVWEEPEISLKFKEKYLQNLSAIIKNLKEKPNHLELKCNQYLILVVNYEIMKQCNIKKLQRQLIILLQISQQNFVSDRSIHFLQKQNANYFLIFRVDIELLRSYAVLKDRVHIKLNQQQFILKILQLKQFAQSLKNPNLKSLRTFKYYYPYVLGQDSNIIESQQLICNYLNNLPELQTVTIVADEIKSLEGWKSLGNKLKASAEKGWRNKIQW